MTLGSERLDHKHNYPEGGADMKVLALPGNCRGSDGYRNRYSA